MSTKGNHNLDFAKDNDSDVTGEDASTQSLKDLDPPGDYGRNSENPKLSSKNTEPFHHTEDSPSFQPKLAENLSQSIGPGASASIDLFRGRLETMAVRGNEFGIRMEQIERLLVELIGQNVPKQYIRHWTKECNDLFRLQVILRKRREVIKDKLKS